MQRGEGKRIDEEISFGAYLRKAPDSDEGFLAKRPRGILQLLILESNIGLERRLLEQMLGAVGKLGPVDLQPLGPSGGPRGPGVEE